jgi:hypothetical protein
MTAPSYLLTATKDSEGDFFESRNPSWCVAFVRFKTPGFMYSGNEKPFAEKPLMVVENDCVSVSINNSKSSFAKTCSLTMKPGDIWYPHAVAPGDYVFVWMSDQQNHIDGIVDALFGKGKVSLNDWRSGLKFFGRVLSVQNSDSISSSGQRSINQTVSCQSFLELSSSVYYSFVAQDVISGLNSRDSNLAAQSFLQNELEKLGDSLNPGQKASIPQKGVTNGMDAALTNLSKAFLNFYRANPSGSGITGDTSPEAIIGLLFIITMGVDTSSNLANNVIPGAKGVFSDAIGIPDSVANIFHAPKASKLWQLYNLNLGLQKYKNTGKNTWEQFSPDFTPESSAEGVFHRSKTRCKGYVPFLMPPIWDNNSFWNIYSQFLNPVVNEMYTVLRCNRQGQIRPHLIVREKPLSTGLFPYLLKKAPVLQEKKAGSPKKKSIADQIKDKIAKEKENKVPNTSDMAKTYEKIAKVAPDLAERTMFGELPRWIIDESVLLSIDTASSESNRINFVQVWGRNRAAEISGGAVSPETMKRVQFLKPNYVSDDGDIKRHGLRADITETNYDVASDDFGTIVDILARQRADWLFNGHLKHFGSVSLQGIQEPICEGDNLQVRGVLFHIDAVSHTGSLDASGRKMFRTVCQVSNGMIASSVSGIPQYPTGNIDFETTNSMIDQNNLPGFTDIQYTGARKNRDDEGEL